MSDSPYMKLWIGDYMADTGHLTTTEHGAYLLLLMAMWRAGGSLPNDDKRLARYAHLQSNQWARMKPVIMEFFTVYGDEITQGRLTAERGAVEQISKKRSTAAHAKWLKNKKPADANASSLHVQNDASHSHSHIKGISGRFDDIRGDVFIQSGSDEYAAWAAWLRKQGRICPNINGGYWFKSLTPPAEEAKEGAA